MQLFGIPKSVGQIYGLLYASSRPLGFWDMVERLGISKGSVSYGMQLLRDLGAVNEVRRTGVGMEATVSQGKYRPNVMEDLSGNGNFGLSKGARILYKPELSLRRLVSGILRERIAPMAATSSSRLTSLTLLAEQNGADRKFYIARVRQLNTWRRRLKAVLPVLIALLGPVHK